MSNKTFKPITDKEEANLKEWLAKQAKYKLIRTSRNYQRECQMCLNILKQRNK
jgi:hypothetical protein